MKKFHKLIIARQSRYFDDCVKAAITYDKKYFKKIFTSAERKEMNVGDEDCYNFNRRKAVHQAYVSLNKNQKAAAMRKHLAQCVQCVHWSLKTTWGFKAICLKVCTGR